MGGPGCSGHLDTGETGVSERGKKNLLAVPHLLELLKQLLDALHGRLNRSLRWFTGTFSGVVQTVVDWLRRPPSGIRSGRVQLNVTEAELIAAMNQAVTFPWMGGKKGAANLVHAQTAWVGAGSYDVIKATIAHQVGEEIQSRRRRKSYTGAV